MKDQLFKLSCFEVAIVGIECTTPPEICCEYATYMYMSLFMN